MNGDEAITRDEEGAALVSLGNLRLLEGLWKPWFEKALQESVGHMTIQGVLRQICGTKRMPPEPLSTVCH